MRRSKAGMHKVAFLVRACFVILFLFFFSSYSFKFQNFKTMYSTLQICLEFFFFFFRATNWTWTCRGGRRRR